MKAQLISLLLLAGVAGANAQITLTAARNGMRDGDEPVKQQIEYLAPGRAGQLVVWDFRQMKPVNDRYTVKYRVYDDRQASPLTVATEHRTMYYFRTGGDTLLLAGHENPSVRLDYTRAQLQLKYPVRYRDTAKAPFSGKGRYSARQDIEVQGTAEVTADAYGIVLLPEGDTLKNALRLHTRQQHVSTGGEAVTTDKYSWYTRGYRYPVVETIKSVTARSGQSAAADYFQTAFYYPIQEQYRLPYDTANEAERDLSADELFGYYAAYPNPCRSELHIDYNLPEDGTDVVFTLYDLQGRKVMQRSHPRRSFGSHTETLDVSGLVAGGYVLEIGLGEKRVKEKILKQ